MKTRFLILALPAGLACAAVACYLSLSEPREVGAVSPVPRQANGALALTATLLMATTAEPAPAWPKHAERQKPNPVVGSVSADRDGSMFLANENDERRFEPTHDAARDPISSSTNPATPGIHLADSASPQTQVQQPVEVVVPAGSQLPAALAADAGESLSVAQTKALDTIADAFVSGLSPLKTPITREGKGTPAHHAQNEPGHWDQLRAAADEQYRVLFGDEAFNRHSAAAAEEALSDR